MKRKICVVLLMCLALIIIACGAEKDSSNNNQLQVNNFCKRISGYWVDLGSARTDYFYCLAIEDNKLNFVEVPGVWDREGTITEVKDLGNDKYEIVVYYPEIEAYDEVLEERTAICSIRVAETTIEFLETGYEFTYMGANLDECTQSVTNMYNSANKTDISGLKNNSAEGLTPIYYYKHTALEGAVIVDSNPDTGQIKYKKKCEECNYIDSATVIEFRKGTSLKSNYFCPKCENNQIVRIEGTKEIEWK